MDYFSNILTLADVVGISGGSDKSSWLHSLWFRSSGASLQAADTDGLFMFIFWVCLLSFALLLALIIYFPFKYHRSKQKINYKVSASHHTLLELTWSVLPLLVMVVIFFWGFKGYMSKLTPVPDAEEIMIRGQKWNWSVSYRNGASTDQDCYITNTQNYSPVFYVPAGRPVKLVMTSTDVIHSFYIPDFRSKIDVFPNRYTSMTFTVEKPDTPGPNGKWIRDDIDKNDPMYLKPYSGHVVFCAEYCGQNHSDMAAWIIALSPEEYEKKIHELATKLPEGNCIQVGEAIARRKGCFQCHSPVGASGTGPTWKDMYGSLHSYTNGENNVLVDENSLRESILYSQKRILNGYTNQMPIYAGQIKPIELDALICYIKSLSAKTSKEELDKASGPLIQEGAAKP